MPNPWYPEKPANHTHRECCVFKQAGKLNAEHKGRETPSEDEDEPHPPNTGGQKKFPPEVKTVNMIHTTRTSLRRHEHAHKDARDIEPTIPTPNYWMSCPITFDHLGVRASIRREGSDALVLDPIINGYHLTHVLMDGGSSLNLIYEDTVRRMGIDSSRISKINTTF